MRNTNLAVNLKGQEFKIAHLFEIELAQIQILSETGTTAVLTVDCIDKCYTDMYLAFPVISGSTWSVAYRQVTKVSLALGQITLNSAIAVSKYQFVCETLYIYDKMPYVSLTNSLYTEHLQMRLSAFGALNGRLMFTDHDLPIITTGERVVFRHPSITDINVAEGNLLYIPFPIAYKEVSVEDKGKINSVEVNISNEELVMGNIAFKHDGFKNRFIAIKTIFLDTAVQSPILKAYDTGNFSTVPTMVDTSGVAVPELNDGFTECLFCANSSTKIIDEFSGETDNVAFDNKVISIKATVRIDNTEHTQSPTRIYSRVHCPFIYKDWRCRFSSRMRLEGISSDGGFDYVYIQSLDKFFYFQNLMTDSYNRETAIIQIDDELILVDKFEYTTTHSREQNERIRQLKNSTNAAERTRYTDECDGRFRLRIKTNGRGYNSTDIVSHTVGVKVDIPICKKTEHDCDLHAHISYFGGFPAIPKNKNYSS